jgi:dUTP pyrophosphatase
MKVNFKKLHKDAVIPTYAKPGDAGMDMTAVAVAYTADSEDFTEKYIEYDTGIAVEIPEGYFGLCVPRSSVTKKDFILKNSCGIIDSGFRDSIKFRFWITKHSHKTTPNGSADTYIDFDMYKKNERIGQLLILPYPKIEMIEVEELSNTERGTGGFGHSGS